MRMDGYTVITPVSVEPITLTDVKAYCRVDFDDDDALLASLLTQCRGYAEGVTRRSIAVKTLQAIVRPDPLPIGRLSGPVGMIDDPTLYAERVTFSPFGTNPFYIELPFPPVQAITTLETQLTAMDVPEWVEVDSTDDNGNLVWRADVLTDPALISFSQPLVASRYRVTFTAGYGTGYKPLPDELALVIKKLVSWSYDNRSGEEYPQSLLNDLLNYRVEYT